MTYASDQVANTFVGSGGAYTPSDNGVNLQAPQGGDYGYNAAVTGAGENYANSALNYYGAGNTPGTTQNTQQAYQQFQNSTPADTSSYYDNAVRQSNNDLNTQMAARGQYGSSNAVGQLSNADTNLRAQQANANAQYGLQRASTAGSLASGADASSATAANNQLAWTQGLGNLALQGQEAGQNRFQQNYDNTMGMANQISGLEGNSYNNEFNNDSSDMSNAINASTGANVQGYQNAVDNSNYNNASDAAKVNLATGIIKAGVGGAI